MFYLHDMSQSDKTEKSAISNNGDSDLDTTKSPMNGKEGPGVNGESASESTSETIAVDNTLEHEKPNDKPKVEINGILENPKHDPPSTTEGENAVESNGVDAVHEINLDIKDEEEQAKLSITESESTTQQESEDKPDILAKEESSIPETEPKPESEVAEESTGIISNLSAILNETNGTISEDQSSISITIPSINHSRQLSNFSMTSSATVDNTQLFKKTFESIITSKEIKKNEEWKRIIQRAIDALNNHEDRDADLIFDALKMTCEISSSVDTKSKAIDLFAKLFDYAQFSDDNEKLEFTEKAVNVVSDCFKHEGTDPELELQVVRALMHSILLMPCHGASLLKAVRQIYNVFIYSLSARNQSVAQGILTQVIGAIFQRITQSKMFNNVKLHSNGSAPRIDTPDENLPNEKLTLQNLEQLDDSVDEDRVSSAKHASSSDEDLVVKDAFLIFRTLCKLSEKPLQSDTVDMKSHPVRSKLLSLHIIHTILKEHIDIFLSNDVVILSSNTNDRTRLINAVRHHISLSLSRNAASSIAPVFELSLEIFWLIISNLRSEFKREIPVFWHEIYFPVADMKSSTPHQKRYLLSIIERICNDSRCIIEFYLNYDCDSSMPNVCEKITEHLTKLSVSRVETTQQQRQAFSENKRKDISVYNVGKISNLISSTMTSKPPEPEIYSLFPVEYALKVTSINCSVAFLRSLYSWAHKGFNKRTSRSGSHKKNNSFLSLSMEKSGTGESNISTGLNSRNESVLNNSELLAEAGDDPEQFENLKQRKKALLEGIRQFNQKGKKGIKFLIENGFIPSDEPRDIALFLLQTDGLDKSEIGEYLGEGDPKNVAIMHAFVDEMDFKDSHFVDAMRMFLQTFRLPGEAQKIDRFMLKFAERYILGNPNVFANADTGYVLAYSVIMLNTDLHSPQVQKKMSLESFIANNNGIDDGKSLAPEYLEQIYNEIQSNEIKLQSEQHAALLAGDISMNASSSTIGFFGGRDANKEAYIHASKEMSNKTEKYLKNLGKRLKTDESSPVYYSASNIFHVRSIFDTLWMSLLAGITPPFKEYDEEEIYKSCLEGIKLSIKIACMFDLECARTSFIGALIQFEKLFQFEEMKPKSVDAIYTMLDIAVSEGNSLKDSWNDILRSISQLDRLQLIAKGIDQQSIPDVSASKINRASIESSSTNTGFFSQFTPSQTASARFHNQQLSPLVALLLSNSELSTAIEKVYTNSANISGDGIFDFVKALAQVADEEIESSGQSPNPRTYSLQKIVTVCYHNMSRIRLEWSQLWAILGESFNSMGCHSNTLISYLALDSLRQLSMGFFEIEELAHFKFQKAFLQPYEVVMANNPSLEVKDLVLECINNMILGKADKIKSGWKTIFETLAIAARSNKESLVQRTYKMASSINSDYIDEVRAQDSYSDLVLCFTNLAKNERFQRVSLQSLDVLSKLMKQTADYSFKNGKTNPSNETLVKLWFPILNGFHDIIMNGEELEVRSRALSSLFDILNQYGQYFDLDFWNKICDELLFKFFNNIRDHWQIEINDNDDPEKVEVWLSTTLIQALTSMINLFSTFFEPLSSRLSDYLHLIILCICQENDTIAKIGRECLSTLLIKNSKRLNQEQWELITESFSDLFKITTAEELFTRDPLKNQILEDDDDDELGDIGSSSDINNGPNFNKEYKMKLTHTHEKSTIVLKSVLQLLLIQLLSELFDKDVFYESIPYQQLNQFAQFLYKSYDFAKTFNDDYDLRVRLWNAGVIERLPNLLKQELSASAVYINIMFRMYCDDDKVSQQEKQDIIGQIIPLCNVITERFAQFDEVNQLKNITLWKKVIIEIYQVYVELDDDDFINYSPYMYNLTMKLLSRQLSSDLRLAIKSFLVRFGEVYVKIKFD